MSLPVLLHKQLPASPRADCPRVHRDLKEPLFVRNLTFFCSFKISSNVVPCSCWVISTWHALLYTKPNLSVRWFSMPKGFKDWSTYKADTRHVKIERNFWTHCSLTDWFKSNTMIQLSANAYEKKEVWLVLLPPPTSDRWISNQKSGSDKHVPIPQERVQTSSDFPNNRY